MLEGFTRWFRSLFPSEDVTIPDVGRPSQKKELTVHIARAKDPDAAEELREELKRSDIVFLDVRDLIGPDKEKLVRRLKVQCGSTGREIYGIDRNWLVVTCLGVEGSED